MIHNIASVQNVLSREQICQIAYCYSSIVDPTIMFQSHCLRRHHSCVSPVHYNRLWMWMRSTGQNYQKYCYSRRRTKFSQNLIRNCGQRGCFRCNCYAVKCQNSVVTLLYVMSYNKCVCSAVWCSPASSRPHMLTSLLLTVCWCCCCCGSAERR